MSDVQSDFDTPLTKNQATAQLMKEFQRSSQHFPATQCNGWRGPNTVLLTFLACVQRDTSIASLLQSIHPALHEICRVLGEFWQSNIKFTHEAWVPATLRRRSGASVQFPTSQNLNINMMPIVLGDDNSLPATCQQYRAMIHYCCRQLSKEEMGKIGYLTVSEKDVAAGTTHRREGLHTETPGSLVIPGKYELDEQEDGTWNKRSIRQSINWGCGVIDVGSFKGGIFTANTVDNSLEVWNAQVMNAHDMVGQGGYCEHLRSMIGTGTKIAANTMVWMTDTTPHESLPLKQSQHRQFFRLVTSDVSVWYSQHSDENPLGIKADPNTTITLNNNKFETSKQPSPWTTTSLNNHHL